MDFLVRQRKTEPPAVALNICYLPHLYNTAGILYFFLAEHCTGQLNAFPVDDLSSVVGY